ncbi:MAG TPA: hypothetical protein VMK12_04750 [Anaeromyxobacteraceae bacterium]|nr:hypothetical protein [Anaeromyxobacteraceae bacterium]
MSNWLEALRDRLVVRSLVGKRKLDAVLIRREFDAKLLALGERFLKLIREGRTIAPQEIAGLVDEARRLEDQLEAQQAEIAALRSEMA